MKANLVMKRKRNWLSCCWSNNAALGQNAGTFETSPVFTVQYSGHVTWRREFIVCFYLPVCVGVCVCARVFLFYICVSALSSVYCLQYPYSFLLAVIAAHSRSVHVRACGSHIKLCLLTTHTHAHTQTHTHTHTHTPLEASKQLNMSEEKTAIKCKTWMD